MIILPTPPKGDLPPPVLSTTPPRTSPGFGFMQVSRAEPLPRGRHRRLLPAISLGRGLVRKYEAEKMYGIRRDNGSRKLTRLTRRHYEILARHLQGQSHEQIHIYMGLSISSISRILNDPLCQTILKRSYMDRQSELDALAGRAIDAIRSAFDGSTSEKLAAVDKYAKLKGVIAPESNPMESAEDFARALVNNGTVNVQINHGR
jgi:hypothetical protein